MTTETPAWHRQALCATGDHDPDLWFSTSPRIIAQARAVCARCPVARECELDGIGQDHGVWAGKAKHRVRA